MFIYFKFIAYAEKRRDRLYKQGQIDFLKIWKLFFGRTFMAHMIGKATQIYQNNIF
jgi:hypothetical protein